MSEQHELAGKTIVMSGGSRGIGLAIGIAAGRLGANVVMLAKTDKPHPRLEGTVHTAAEQIRAAGGQALGVVGDVRDEESVNNAIDQAVREFGGVDVVVNNASAISLTGTEATSPKQFDLMQSIQQRGTFLLTRAAIPHLRKSSNPHVLSLSPPLNLSPKWLGAFPPYTLAKYGMTLLTLGIAAELEPDGIAANCLWPESVIATAATEMLMGDKQAEVSRKPEIMADAAILILSSSAAGNSGRALIDVDVLAAHGITDLTPYGPSEGVALDLYLDK
ncbi:SDR family oxidoreductase [Lolliginicoccus levis]|uniref:SDR family oxidoreductase n=1 Tax=Lolliginicoccus levis TaxID=2919542 RepID=UPI00241D07E1|nr:NAD(P)-dependent oxidoreductase [Lolliginicoccus levis]